MKTGCEQNSLGMKKRRKTVSVSVGAVRIGSKHPIVVQSMTSTDTHDVRQTLRQINQLVRAGCELIRVAVPDQAAIQALREIVQKSPLPVIADIPIGNPQVVIGGGISLGGFCGVFKQGDVVPPIPDLYPRGKEKG